MNTPHAGTLKLAPVRELRKETLTEFLLEPNFLGKQRSFCVALRSLGFTYKLFESKKRKAKHHFDRVLGSAGRT